MLASTEATVVRGVDSRFAMDRRCPANAFYRVDGRDLHAAPMPSPWRATETEAEVDATGEPVDGIEARDVFVVEEIDSVASAPTSRLAPSGSLG